MSDKIFIATKQNQEEIKLTIDDIKALVDARLDAVLSSRASQASLDAIGTNINTANTNINAIKTKTDLIGVSNPTANTTTVMGYLKTVYDKVNTSGGLLVGAASDTVQYTTGIDITRAIVPSYTTWAIVISPVAGRIRIRFNYYRTDGYSTPPGNCLKIYKNGVEVYTHPILDTSSSGTDIVYDFNVAEGDLIQFAPGNTTITGRLCNVRICYTPITTYGFAL